MTLDQLETLIAQHGPYERVGSVFNVEGHLDLRSLTTLPEGVTFNVWGYLDLNRLTTLPEGVTFNAGRYLDLDSLTSIPEGVTLNVRGHLDLNRLTTLPEGVTFNVWGHLYLSSLTTEPFSYQGKTIRIRTIDGICTRLISKRKVGAATLWSGQYFKGNLTTDKRCYIAQDGDDYAHGDTAEKALADLRFKVLSRDHDPDELIAKIKKRGTVELIDYRLLTGACESGTRQHLLNHGIDPDTTTALPLAKALEISRSGYGGQTFARMMGAEA